MQYGVGKRVWWQTAVTCGALVRCKRTCAAWRVIKANGRGTPGSGAPGTPLCDTPAARGAVVDERAGQRGFSLVEVSIVTAIVLLIAVIGIPMIGSYVMENKVPKVGQELARFVMYTRVNASTSSEVPYTGIATANLASMVSDSTVLTLGSGGSVLHGLGGGGTVEVEPSGTGSGFSLRLSKVNHVACPSIASMLQRVADKITVSADGGSARVVKDDATPYSALATEAVCQKGDVNQFTFHVG